MTAIRVLPAGDRAVLVELPGLDEAVALFGRAKAQGLEGVQELIPAARTMLVRFDPVAVPVAAVVDWLRTLGQQLDRVGRRAAGGKAAGGAAMEPVVAARCVEIPVQYVGEDLDELAQQLGMTPGELVERHTGRDYLAAFAGFSPGFVYLTDGDPCFDAVARHAVPRTRVPAGSVAVASGFCAIYPSDSPGGWRLLGKTPLRLWDLSRPEPALLQPGLRVRFRDMARGDVHYSLPAGADGEGTPPAADSQGAADLHSAEPALRQRDAMPPGRAWLEVLDAGMQTLVQDLGRPGHAALGVSRSGALDRAALRAANQLVGNTEDAPVLENVLGALQLVCHGEAVVAVAGAPVGVAMTTATGMRVPAAAGVALTMQDGYTLRLGRLRAGLRCYVAVRGGWDVPPVLGSVATDVLAGLGPAPLRKGDCLPVAATVAPQPAAAPPSTTGDTAGRGGYPSPGAGVGMGSSKAGVYPRVGEAICLDVVLGPRDDWFDAQALKTLVEQDWEVTPHSNRVGLRLHGARPLTRARAGELQSEGMIAGAIEIPPSGQPVLFLADHPITGGYPVIAVVVDRDLDRLAQVPPGGLLRFRVVT